MKFPMNRLFAAVLAAAAMVLPLAQGQAQEIKPVAVVSIASLDKILSDVEYLTAVAGSPDVGKLASGMAGIYINGLDRTKPSGAIVTVEGMEPKVTAFLPVKDFKAVLATLRNNGLEGRDAGGGVLQFGAGDQSVYVKEQPGWAFIAQKPEHLAKLPADPSKLTGGLDKNYNLAVQVNMTNLPRDVKQMAVSFLKSQAEAGLRDQVGNAADREAAEKITQNSVKSIVALIEETDQVTIGWGVDRTGKSTYLDVSMTAVAGTTTAKRMAQAGDAKSNFAGFLMSDAAVTLNLTQKLLKEDIDQYTTLLKPLRAQALKEIDNDADVPAAQKAEAKDVLGSLIDVVQGTLESGKIDGGASLFLEPKALSFAAGIYVADGATLEKSVKKGAAILAKTEPDFPNVKFDAEKHAGVAFHTLSIPVPGGESEARQLLGDQLDVVLGTGAKAFYIAFGKGSSATLKKVIDKSATDAQKTVPPLQLNVSLTPIAKTAAAMNDNPIGAVVVGALEQSGGKDHVRITNKPIQRGVVTRVDIEEGVLQVIGQAAKMFTQGGGRPPF